MDAKLLQDIIYNIEHSSGGYISFADFMQQALYHPSLGYYSRRSVKFGSKGDFTTAPELSPLFSQCLAKQCMEICRNLASNIIVEFGAGTGTMAATIINAAKPEKYYIVEISAHLRAIQQQTIAEFCGARAEQVAWISLDEFINLNFSGVVLANEVLDAMPVTCFSIRDNIIYERVVTLQNKQLHWRHVAANTGIAAVVAPLVQDKNYQAYDSEINLQIKPWLEAISAAIQRGVVLTIDYGFPAAEYYHEQRSMGTLMCHYQHKNHADPFINIGCQDITAHVDFTAVADLALDVGFKTLGYSNQAAFLLSLGLLEFPETVQSFREVNVLTSAAEMGELFKVIALGKNYDFALQGFKLANDSYRL